MNIQNHKGKAKPYQVKQVLLAIEKYTYRVTWSEEDGEFVGLCAEFPSLSWLDETPEDALKGVRSLVSECVVDMAKNTESIPSPIATRQYSGKFMVRVPPGYAPCKELDPIRDGLFGFCEAESLRLPPRIQWLS